MQQFAKTRFRRYLTTSSKQLWSQVVDRYCHLQLTNPSDKLPAIAGIAQLVSRTRPNARYLAGLWSDRLAQDVLRSVSHSYKLEPPLPLPATYRAPSWTWAAVEGLAALPGVS
jgi:hypothetical protein